MSSSHHLGMTTKLQQKASIKVGAGSLNLPIAQAVQDPLARDVIKYVNPSGQLAQFGQFMDFTISPSDLHVLSDIVFAISVGALTGTGGTYISFVNDFSFAIQRLEISHGDSILETIYPETIYTMNLAHYKNEEKSGFLPLMGNNTVANRRAASAGPRTFYISLPTLFNVNRGFFLPSLNGNIKVRIYLDQLANVIQTDKTVPLCNIASAQLRIYGKEILDRGEVNRIVLQNRQLGSTQYNFLQKTLQSKVPLAAGQTQYNILLSGISGFVSHIFIICRANTSVNGGATYSNSPDTFKGITKFTIKNNSGALITGVEYDDAFVRNLYSTYYLTGDLTDIESGLAGTSKNVYLLSFNSNIEDSIWQGTQNCGYVFNNTSETLSLTFSDSTTYASGLDVASVVDVVVFTYAMCSLDGQGNLKRV